MKSLLIVAFLALVASALATQKSYEGYKVYRVQVENDEQAAALDKLSESFVLDFWTKLRRQGPVDIMVEPDLQQLFQEELDTLGLKYSVMIPNLKALLDQEAKAMEAAKLNKKKQGPYNMDWDSYHNLEDMYEYFDYLETNYDSVTTEIIGQSFEGRNVTVLKICRDGCGNKPTLFIDAGIHAREWITPATATYMINELTENFDADNDDLLANNDWYFVPSVNPDGYAYTQTNERLWRKTRSDNGNICIGTDANRNFGYKWNTGGSSDSSCSDTYHGPSAFSEKEAQNIRNFVDANKDHIKFYNDLHSYSQLILTPWGFTDERIPDYAAVKNLADIANSALAAVHGKQYEVGCIPCLLYIASGGSIDYTYGDAGIKYSYTVELRDTGLYGFLLPPNQIIPTGEEIFAFHASAARQIAAEFAQH